jgi:hypothetical protein
MRIRLAAIALFLAPFGAPAFGQGCAMCYKSALGASPAGQKALSRAVTVLLIPPVGMMSLLVGAGFLYARRRDQRADAEQDLSADS